MSLICLFCGFFAIGHVLRGEAAWLFLHQIDGSSISEIRTTWLGPVEGIEGIWQQGDFRTYEGNRVHITWLQGQGVDDWRVPPLGTNGDDGPIGSGAYYKVLLIDGRPAILEKHPQWGVSLAIRFFPNGVLTLESLSCSEEELLQFAPLVFPK